MDYYKNPLVMRKGKITIIVLMLITMISFFPHTICNAESEVTTSVTIEYLQPSSDSVIKKGDRGDDVRWLQSVLNQVIDADLIIDGEFGIQTEKALIKYQSEYGLETNGIADEATLSLINLMLYQEEITETPATEKASVSDSPDANNEQPSETIRPEINRKHPFISYWKEYFVTFKNIIIHFKTTISPALRAGKGFSIFSIVLIALALIGMIPVTVMIIYVDSNGMDTGNRKMGTEPLVSSGCLGNAIILILLFALLSPLVSDIIYMKYYFDISIVKAFFISCLYGILRFCISVIGFIVVWILFIVLLYILVYIIKLVVGFPSELVYTVSGNRQKCKELMEAHNDFSYKNYLQVSLPSDDAYNIITNISFLPAIASLLLFNYIIPIIMAAHIFSIN